jgi:hypothetical protein
MNKIFRYKYLILITILLFVGLYSYGMKCLDMLAALGDIFDKKDSQLNELKVSESPSDKNKSLPSVNISDKNEDFTHTPQPSIKTDTDRVWGFLGSQKKDSIVDSSHANEKEHEPEIEERDNLLENELDYDPNYLNSFTPEEKGYRIVIMADYLEKGFQDYQATTKMILYHDKMFTKTIRDMRVKVLETEDDGDMSLMVFDSPRDVRGTGYLTHAHKQKSDDQWLYLPALNRIKRISSSSKSGSFMGTEFTFEDFPGQEIEKSSYKWLRDAIYRGETYSDGTYKDLECYVIEKISKDKDSSNLKNIVWIDKTNLLYQKVDFYDGKRNLLKTLTYSDYKLYLKRFYRPRTMRMKNHQTGKRTIIHWRKYSFKTGLKKKDFYENALSVKNKKRGHP